MSNARATVIAHSVSDQGIPLVTFQLRYWRPIHAECRTHRVLSQTSEQIVTLEREISLMDDRDMSRNAGSSRARPSKAIIEQVRTNPWGPLHWGKNKPGMQASEELKASERVQAERAWKESATYAAKSAQLMLEAGAHKQIVNRLLEPYTYIDVVMTGTDFANWFALRDHSDADPGIQNLAQVMKEALAASTPAHLQPGQWHLPYITEADWEAALQYIKAQLAPEIPNVYKAQLEIVRKISAARCARVSYKAFDGTVSPIAADLELFNKLVRAELVHASPTEHQATPDFREGDTGEWLNPEMHGNFRGWVQHRKLIPNEYVAG